MHLVHRSLLILLVTLTILVPGFAAVQAHAPKRAQAAMVKIVSSQLLVTAKGMTLYIFAPDKPNQSTCYGTCAKFWPPLIVPSGTTPASTISGAPGKFGVTTRTDGTQQLTYDRAPLYTFKLDKKPGDMKGQGLVASGGYWWAVAVPAATSSGSGSGY